MKPGGLKPEATAGVGPAGSDPKVRHSLAVTITIALIVKVAILYGIHKAFFSEPQAKHMRMPTAKVEQHLIAAPAAPLHELPPKDNDGSHR